MGLFSNPLGHAGYPPSFPQSVSGVQQVAPQNTTVRAATTTEASEGKRADCYISPVTLTNSSSGIFASPPPLGDVTPNEVYATTLSSTLDTTLATDPDASSVTIFAGVPTASRSLSVMGGGSAQTESIDFMSGVNTTSPHRFRVFNGISTGGTNEVTFFGGASTGTTSRLNVLTGPASGTNEVVMGTCAGTVTFNLGTSTGTRVFNFGNATTTIGFFGTAAAAKQTQGAITNNVTVGGTTGTIANFTDLTVYANDAATIRNDIFQLALGLKGCIDALRLYGLLG
jgi:hypothetical protein